MCDVCHPPQGQVPMAEQRKSITSTGDAVTRIMSNGDASPPTAVDGRAAQGVVFCFVGGANAESEVYDGPYSHHLPPPGHFLSTRPAEKSRQPLSPHPICPVVPLHLAVCCIRTPTTPPTAATLRQSAQRRRRSHGDVTGPGDHRGTPGTPRARARTVPTPSPPALLPHSSRRPPAAVQRPR